MRDCLVVLIEDNPADVLLVRLALTENNVDCQLKTFENGQVALTALCPAGAKEPAQVVPDAILLDLSMPRRDGFEVLAKLRATPHLSEVPIAILTSSQTESDKARSRLLGAVRFIHKPSAAHEFLETVGQAVREMISPAPPAAPPSARLGS